MRLKAAILNVMACRGLVFFLSVNLFRVCKKFIIRFKSGCVDPCVDYLLGPLDGFTDSAKRRIVKIVSRAVGEHLRFAGFYRLEGVSTSDAGRSFWVVELLSGNNLKFSVFVKVSSITRRGIKISQMLNSLDLPTPFCYGYFLMRGRGVALWQYQEGFGKRFFRTFTDVELKKAARAIGTYNVLGLQEDVVRFVGRKQFWSSSVSAKLKIFVRKYPLLQVRVDVLGHYVRFEPLMLDVLFQDSRMCLDHNDFKASNIIFLNSGDCLLADLDSTSIGVFGASLRCFAVMPLQRRILVVEAYVERLKELGVNVLPASIHQVLCAQQVLWAFHTGIRLCDVERVKRGLDLFCSLYSVKDGRLFLDGVGELTRA